MQLALYTQIKTALQTITPLKFVGLWNNQFERQDKNDSIKRRLDADEIDFQDFKDYDLKITDPEFTADDVYSFMD